MYKSSKINYYIVNIVNGEQKEVFNTLYNKSHVIIESINYDIIVF